MKRKIIIGGFLTLIIICLIVLGTVHISVPSIILEKELPVSNFCS